MSRGAAKRKPKNVAIAVAALLALCAAGVIGLAGSPKPVLRNARVFCEVPAWRGQQLPPTYNHYYWITNNEALVADGRNPTGFIRVGLDPSGRAEPPKPLPFAVTADNDLLSVSPDGRSVAYIQSVSRTPGVITQYLVARSLDGRKVVKWVYDGRGDLGAFVWTPDSSSLVALQCRPEACLRRFDLRSGRLEKIALPPELRLAYRENATLLGFTWRGALLAALGGAAFQNRRFFDDLSPGYGAYSANYPRMPLIELSLDGIPHAVRAFSPSLPEGAGVGFVELSPTGDRLFWGALCAKVPSPLEVRLHRYLAFVPGDPAVVERGWVSQLDGSGMKELGFYEIPSGNPGPGNPAGPPWLIDPKWTPDGRRIGLVHGDRLLTIPAD